VLWKKQAQVVGHALEKAKGSSNLVAQALNSKKVTLCFGKSLGHALEKAKGTHTQFGKGLWVLEKSHPCGLGKGFGLVAVE
jgi:hypothetical protein